MMGSASGSASMSPAVGLSSAMVLTAMTNTATHFPRKPSGFRGGWMVFEGSVGGIIGGVNGVVTARIVRCANA